jgi:hypothetical protein
MNISNNLLSYKRGFKNVTFCAMPVSILFIVRKRLNFAFLLLGLFGVLILSTI